MPKEKKLVTVEVPVSELNPSEYNPRKWDGKAVQDLSASIQSFGFVEPIIVNNAESRKNVVIGGHFRLHVAKQLGYQTVPVIYVTIDDLDKEKELNLRLNKNTGWFDYDLLQKYFDTTFLYDAGFTPRELRDLEEGIDASGSPDEGDSIEEMELQLYEKYDYIVLAFKNTVDFDSACEKLKIEKKKIKYGGDFEKIGLGRVVDGARVLKEHGI